MFIEMMEKISHVVSFLKLITFFCVLKIFTVTIVYADRATHWDQYQASRNPYMELGLFALGAIAAIGLLYALSKITEKK